MNKCIQIGVLAGGRWDKQLEKSRRVYGLDGVSPTLMTFSGGGQILKVGEMTAIEKNSEDETNVLDGLIIYDAYNSRVRTDQTAVGTITTNVGNDAERTGQRLIKYTERDGQRLIRVRKYTERECFKLMGVKCEDFDRIEPNQSASGLYHLAGDSIITSCMMAIFGEMIGADWKEKVEELQRDLQNQSASG